MSQAPLPPPLPGADGEIAGLIDLLHDTDARLETLLGGEVDSVTSSGGSTMLLRRAQSDRRLYERTRQTELLAESQIANTSLQHTTGLLHSLINGVPDPVYVKDTDGKYLICNRVFAAYAGRTPEEMGGGDHRSIFGSEHAESAARMDREVMATGCNMSLEMVVRVTEGLRTFLVTVAPYRSPEGTLLGVIGIGHDISSRKQAEEELRSLNADLEARVRARTAELDTARDEAEQANRAKSIFLASMSHEIRTPMNGVIGMLDVLHQTSLKGHQVEMLDLISESAFSLLGIIDDILDFSKMEAGKLTVELLPMALGDVVEKVCAMLDDIALKRGVRLTVFVDPAIPACLMGDAGRLRQVLVNLATNAIKFSGDRELPGRVSVRALMTGSANGRATIALVLSDNGIGMDADTQARLFLPFSQADATTTRRFGGTGLGLAISSMLVDLMGGSIAVESRQGQGSVFTVTLSLALAAETTCTVDTATVEPVLPAVRYCVVGSEQPLAGDIAAVLAGAGVTLLEFDSLAAAARAAPGQGGWTWIVLPDAGMPPIERFRALIGKPPGGVSHVLSLGWGKRRHPRIDATDLVLVDANNLSRRLLREALAALLSGSVVGTASHDEHRSLRGPAPLREAASRQGRLILVAEDNQTNRQVILQQLRLSGYVADIVKNGQEALERWRVGNYALILTDLNMPQMDGYALATAVRAEESGDFAALRAGQPRSRTRTPIIAFTANALPEDAARCEQVGMDAYLVKPVRLAQLNAVLTQWVGPAGEGGVPGTGGLAGAPDDAAAPGAGVAAEETADPADDTTPLDLAVLAALVGDDEQVIDQILATFRASSAECLATIGTALARSDAEAVAGALHMLRSGARSVGGAALADSCGDMSSALAQGDLAGARDIATRLAARIAAVHRFIDLRLA